MDRERQYQHRVDRCDMVAGFRVHTIVARL
jgi:hypothetical protein